jgi:SAM-dependent methyltransferase
VETNYLTVTEIAGDEVTQEQIERLINRYYWAGQFCFGKEVVEVACGTGQGLGYLNNIARSFEAGDYSGKIIEIARRHYGERIPIKQFDAQDMPYADQSKDVIILFEAIYYLPNAGAFVRECARVLRPAGCVLISTANKDLYDFNPSPHSNKYYGVVELGRLFSDHGFQTEFYGDSPLTKTPILQKVLRPIKKIAVSLGIIPKTMSGKKFLKKLVFGKLVTMPPELPAELAPDSDFLKLSPDEPDRRHKIIFCMATHKN